MVVLLSFGLVPPAVAGLLAATSMVLLVVWLAVALLITPLVWPR
ncbi:MAG: hypothetical protein WCA29_10980 [Jiangellales bacterium]